MKTRIRVWDVDRKKPIEGWVKKAAFAFAPDRPVLAVFERNELTGKTRLGLWDFTAAVDRK